MVAPSDGFLGKFETARSLFDVCICLRTLAIASTQKKIREQAALLNVATDAIVRDLKTKFLFWNKSAERIYGWKEEVLGKNAISLYHDLHQIAEVMRLVVEQGEWQGELHKVTKSGRNHCSKSLDIGTRSRSEFQINLSVDTDITENNWNRSFALNGWRALGFAVGTYDLNNVLAQF